MDLQRLRLEAILEQRRRERRGVSLLNFVPSVSPNLSAPKHLSEFASELERALREPVLLLVSMPPQHGKTTLAEHALVMHLERTTRRHLYLTYSQERASLIEAEALPIAEAAGVEFTKRSQKFWRTKAGGQLRWAGVGVGIGGTPVDGLVFVDDPYEGMAEAQSPVQRAAIEQWFKSVVVARRHPGSSIVVLSTRWHPDDLIGVLTELELPNGKRFRVINYPAVCVDEATDPCGRKLGGALWPECRPGSFLDEQRVIVGDFAFDAEYMGRPRPPGHAVFREVYRGSPPPGASIRYGIGVDCASTESTYADHSVAVLGCAWDATDPRTGRPVENIAVLRVWRGQVTLDKFAAVLQAWQEQYDCDLHWFGSGTEKGSAQLMRRLGVRRFRFSPATTDKFSRAQGAAAAWNRGGILLPDVSRLPREDPRRREVEEWIGPFIREVLGFTGTGDKRDDQVDALSSLHALLSRRLRVAVLDAPTASQPSTLALANGSNGGGQTDLAIEAMLRQQGL